MKDFYQRCRFLWMCPLWPRYLQWVYKRAFQDAQMLHISPINKRKNAICLLCGCAGEVTAEEFIQFVLRNNPQARIKIIDIGEEQIKSIKTLVKKKFPRAKIEIKQVNALDLGFIKDTSIDWIETDGFFSFFDEKHLLKLLVEWKRILRDDGFITFRELTSHGLLSRFINSIRVGILRWYLGIHPYLHTIGELERDFHKLHFVYTRGCSPIPLFDRYCLLNQT